MAYNKYAISMSAQLDMFKEYIRKLEGNIGAKNAHNIITNSVVVVVAGNNDLLLALPLRRLQYDVPAYSNMLVKLVLNFTQEIYTLGVRRIVVFNAPPIGCFPAIRTLAGGPQRTCVDTENNLAQIFNNILRQELQFWTTSLPQSRVAFIEYYNTLINIIKNPHKYGHQRLIHDHLVINTTFPVVVVLDPEYVKLRYFMFDYVVPMFWTTTDSNHTRSSSHGRRSGGRRGSALLSLEGGTGGIEVDTGFAAGAFLRIGRVKNL
ncbi:hypothetical protein R6Q59_010920 [Mikania micrantha]